MALSEYWRTAGGLMGEERKLETAVVETERAVVGCCERSTTTSGGEDAVAGASHGGDHREQKRNKCVMS